MILLLDHSTHLGQVGLADADRLVGTLPIPPRQRHNVDLMLAVAELCANHAVKPADLAAVYLTLGPGSFTGLRVAVATAKMLALTSPHPDFRVVGVPNLDLLHAQHPHALIALNLKRGTAWSVGPDALHLPPAWRTLDELDQLRRDHDLPLFAENLEHAIAPTPDLHALLQLAHHADAQPTSGGEASGIQRDAFTLAPAYLREPEAVTLWDEKESRTPNQP